MLGRLTWAIPARGVDEVGERWVAIGGRQIMRPDSGDLGPLFRGSRLALPTAGEATLDDLNRTGWIWESIGLAIVS